MTKKQIQELAKESYTREVLDPEKVQKISDLLTRYQLKQYIDELKALEKKKNVLITLPYMPKEEEQRQISSYFPGKKIIYNIDPSLMAGVKIVQDDLITELSLKNTLENLLDHITENYD